MTIAIPAQQERDRRCLAVLGTAHGALRTSFLSSVPKASPRGSPLPVRRCVPVPPRVLAPRFPPRAPAARGQQRLRRRLGGRGHRSPGRPEFAGGVGGAARLGCGEVRGVGLRAPGRDPAGAVPRPALYGRPQRDLSPSRGCSEAGRGCPHPSPEPHPRDQRLALPCSGLGQRALLPPP